MHLFWIVKTKNRRTCPEVLWAHVEAEGETKGLFGTAHNSFMRCCELFFFCQTLISKTASWVKLFFLSSHKDISWMKLEKSSLL